MEMRNVVRGAGKAAKFVAFGGAWVSMMKTKELLGSEFRRTGRNVTTIKELAALAGEGLKTTFGKDRGLDVAFADMVAARDERSPSLAAVYYHFLRRKRACLGSLAFFLLAALVGALQSRITALVPLVVGGGLSLELAWLAEFRLWQMRGRKLSVAEGATLGDFARESGAWRRALSPESGYGLHASQRRYRRLLWHKRGGLGIAALGALTTLDMYFSSLVRLSAVPACIAAAGMLYAMATELRLRPLRRGI